MPIDVSKSYLLTGMRNRLLNGVLVKVVAPDLLGDHYIVDDVNGVEYNVGAEQLELCTLDRDEIRVGALLAVKWYDGYTYPLFVKEVKGPGVRCWSFTEGSEPELCTVSHSSIRAAKALAFDCDFMRVGRGTVMDWNRNGLGCEPVGDWMTAHAGWLEITRQAKIEPPELPQPALTQLGRLPSPPVPVPAALMKFKPAESSPIKHSVGSLMAIRQDDGSSLIMISKEVSAGRVIALLPTAGGDVEEVTVTDPKRIVADQHISAETSRQFTEQVMSSLLSWSGLHSITLPPMKGLTECWRSVCKA